MRKKKFYIPIGALIIAICAIAFFALRSDIPKEPILIIKTVTPARQITIPQTPITAKASLPIETETPVSGAEVSEVPMSYLLSEFPGYETMNSVSQEVTRELARLRWEGENRRARKAKIIQSQEIVLAALRKEAKDVKELEELAAYAKAMENRIANYPDVLSFIEKYPFPFTTNDILQEYPNTSNRLLFLKNFLEYDDLRIELSNRVLNSSVMVEMLSQDEIERLKIPSIKNLLDPKIVAYIENGGSISHD